MPTYRTSNTSIGIFFFFFWSDIMRCCCRRRRHCCFSCCRCCHCPWMSINRLMVSNIWLAWFFSKHQNNKFTLLYSFFYLSFAFEFRSFSSPNNHFCLFLFTLFIFHFPFIFSSLYILNNGQGIYFGNGYMEHQKFYYIRCLSILVWWCVYIL